MVYAGGGQLCPGVAQPFSDLAAERYGNRRTLLGLTDAATVTPVSGLCRRLFGTSGITVICGVTLSAHQAGGFLSAWLGGVCFERSAGSL